MSLSPNSRLGTHEIIGLLGAGGMGEVYRARDTRLNRQVAIKVLPAEYAGDADRVARFEREAQAVAALNHRNIAAIYNFEESGDLKFLVLELVEGEALADRLQRGAIPIPEALAIAAQILEALEAAHERGICHRDLKPANIKLSADGTVKVLDFGLARFLETAPSNPNVTNSPTLTLGATMQGVILGTAGYMSPEQAKGLPADARSDLFAFGCILFELLTGRQAFEGESISEILAGVLKVDVDLTTLPPQMNPRLRDLLRRCLEKQPKKRWHAAADVRAELETISQQPFAVAPEKTAVHVPVALWRRAIPWAAGAAVGALIAVPAARLSRPQATQAVTRFGIPLPDGQQFTTASRQAVVISPDGSTVVYVANNRLYVRPMAAAEPSLVPDLPAGAASPAFSPDGKSLAFFSVSDNALKRISLAGGPVTTLAPTELPFGISWGEGGIVFSQAAKGIFRVSPDGGSPELLVTLAQDEMASLPQLLPGGRAVLFSVKKIGENWDVGKVVVQVIGGERKTLVDGAADGRYLTSGHLVYARGVTLHAVRFDASALSVSGAAAVVAEGVRRGGVNAAGSAVAQFSVANNGTVAYLPGAGNVSDDIVDLAIFDRAGAAKPLGLKPARYRFPRVSPDGRFVAFDIDEERETNVWVYEFTGGKAMQRLTFGGNNRYPVWSRDGRWITYQSDRDGDLAIFRQLADGSGAAERLTRPEQGAEHIPQSWSRGDGHLLFSVVKDQQWTLWMLAAGERRAAPFGDVRSVDLIDADFSPDGRWVAYQAREANERRMVFVQPFPSTGAKYLARQEGGGHPYWSAKGDELTLNVGPGASVRVPFTATPRVAFGEPIDLPRAGREEPNPSLARRSADAFPDGEHLIGLYTGAMSPSADPLQIRVVLNWFDEVRAKVPTR